MNYDEMKDGAVNKCVFIAGAPKGRWGKDATERWDEMTLMEQPNYCGRVSDAWPIIVENKIDIQWCDNSALCLTFGYDGDSLMTKDTNPLRAAMIVFLKLKESEK